MKVRFRYQGFNPHIYKLEIRKTNKGLKQLMRVWFYEFRTTTMKNGYCQSHIDHIIFVKGRCSRITILAGYADKILVVGWWRSYMLSLWYYEFGQVHVDTGLWMRNKELIEETLVICMYHIAFMKCVSTPWNAAVLYQDSWHSYFWILI